MPAIQSLGVGSGLDANSIITQLLAIERQPLARLQQTASGIQSEISAFGVVASRVDTLKSTVSTLASASTWTATSTKNTDASALKVTAANTANPVDLDIQVTTLARAQSTATATFASASAAIGASQDLTIGIGTWSGSSFTASSAITVNLLATDTLADVRDKINAAGANVTATILSDSAGSRLVIRSNSTGASNAFRITSTVSGSPFSFTDPTSFNQTAANLSATVNGATVTSTTNTLTNLVEGVTVTALKTTTSPISVSVSKDLDGIKSKISNFVSAYNDLIGYLRQQTAYNEATKTGGTLQGDRLAVGLQSQIRSVVQDSTAASGVFERLSEVGIRLQKDGSLSIDSSTLDSGLQNLTEVSELFSRDDALATNDGFAVRLKSLIDGLTGSSGTVTSKTEALRNRLSRNQDQQERMNDRLALTEARLKAQYTRLDEKMASLSGLGSYVSQQVQLLNKSSSR